MRLIDTHTHLYQPKFDSDREEAVARCFAEGVDTLLLPNIDLESVPRVLSMMEKWPDCLFRNDGAPSVSRRGGMGSGVRWNPKSLGRPSKR